MYLMLSPESGGIAGPPDPDLRFIFSTHQHVAWKGAKWQRYAKNVTRGRWVYYSVDAFLSEVLPDNPLVCNDDVYMHRLEFAWSDISMDRLRIVGTVHVSFILFGC